MKEQFLQYLTNEIEAKKAFLSKNELSEADRETIDSAIANLQSIKDAMEAAEEVDPAVLEEMKTTIQDLQDKLQVVSEKLIAQTKENPETMIENYLKTNDSVKAFANAIRTSHNSEEFRSNWNKVLVENGITISDGSEAAYLPDVVKGMIEDKWEKDASWLKDLRLTGAKRFYVRTNDSTQTDETSRAKGHKAGDTKASQSITLSAKLIEADFIYKLMEIDVKTEWDDESLVKYVVDELGDQIMFEIKRAILVGDGRAADNDYKITSFEAIVRANTDKFVTKVSGNASNHLIDELVKTVNAIHNPNAKPIYAFMTKAALTSLRRFQASETATPMYLPVEQIAEQLGVAKIIETSLMTGNNMVAMIPDEYVLVGDPLAPAYMKDHDIRTNVNIYREELCIGGGVKGLGSASFIAFE